MPQLEAGTWGAEDEVRVPAVWEAIEARIPTVSGFIKMLTTTIAFGATTRADGGLTKVSLDHDLTYSGIPHDVTDHSINGACQHCTHVRHYRRLLV